MFLIHYITIIVCQILISSLYGREVVELQSLNFELAITSYQYVAVLFYDSSEKGRSLTLSWTDAAKSVNKLCKDCEMAMIDASDPELKERVDAYMLNVPCIRIFRRGIMGDYRGPVINPIEIGILTTSN